MRLQLFLSALFCTAAITPLSAQNISSLPTPQEVQEDTKEVLSSGTPLSRPAATISESNLQIATTRGEQELSLGVDFELFSSAPVNPSPNGEFSVSSLNLSITGATPISDPENEAEEFFSGGSFVNGSRLSLAMTYFTGRQKDARALTAGNNSVYDRVTRACALQEARIFAGSDAQKQALAADFETKINQYDPVRSQTFFTQYIEELDDSAESLTPIVQHIQTNCISGVNLTSLTAKYLPSATRELYSAALVDSPMFFFGASGTVGDKNFEVLDRTNFVVDEVSRTPWEAKAYAGLIGPDLDWSLRASAFHGASYEAPDSVEFCRTPMGGEEECIMGPDGTPIRSESTRIALEGRYLFELLKGNKIGVAPEITFDLEQDDVLIEVPVYFSPNKEGQLTGGIITTYDSEDDDFSIGLFVGIPFSIAF